MSFLNLCQDGEAAGSYAENQKIMAIRRVYQRAVMMPLSNVEQLWRDYSTFEQVSLAGCFTSKVHAVKTGCS